MKWIPRILAAVAVLSWIGIYLVYFSRDLQRWRRERPRRRAEAAAAAKRKADAQARVLDELASKYPLPPPQNPPQG